MSCTRWSKRLGADLLTRVRYYWHRGHTHVGDLGRWPDARKWRTGDCNLSVYQTSHCPASQGSPEASDRVLVRCCAQTRRCSATKMRVRIVLGAFLATMLSTTPVQAELGSVPARIVDIIQ